MKSSAPGKVILFGEHAVVYSRPALAVPVTQVHVDVEVLDSSHHGIWIHAPGIDLHDELGSLPDDHPVGSVIRKVLSPPFSSTNFLNEKMEGRRGMDISIESTIPVGDALELVVEDNGAGFPDEALPRLFDKFFRVAKTHRHGIGLGLSIAKGFVEAHGGSIAAENRSGGGARFVIRIPALATV